MTKILIAGLGGIGQRHLRNVRTLLGVAGELCAVDPRPSIPVLTDQLQVEAGTTLAEKYNLRIYPDLEPALAWKMTNGFSSRQIFAVFCNCTRKRSGVASAKGCTRRILAGNRPWVDAAASSSFWREKGKIR